MGIKITVIGGASSYTPELFANIIDFRERLDVDRVTLMDPGAEKLTFVAGVCQRVLEEAGADTELATTQEYDDAITGADFIIMQIRVGGLAARVRDETVPVEFDMVGNETTGAGGFACALRTVPAALEIAHHIERLAPEAWLLNLSNPAGIVTEALLKHSKVRTLGFCNIPINTTYELAEVFDVDPTTARLDSFGLNHLSWTRAFYAGGKELLRPLMDETRDRESVLYQRGLVETMIAPEWLHTIGMIPGWYLRYFYYPERVLEGDRLSAQTRGQEDMESEEQLREIYLTSGYGEEAQRVLKKKGGAQYYLPVLQTIDSIVHDRGDVIVVDVKNEGSLPDLPPDACVEVPARIRKGKAEPLPVGPMPLNVRGLVQAVKTYEELTVEAAITGDQGAALAALMVHPLVGSYPKARGFLDRVLENERPYIPAFSR
jgi:6-phospho-beta-glucosidase